MKNPRCATSAPRANIQLKKPGVWLTSPKRLYTIKGKALEITSIRLRAMSLTPRGDWLRNTERIGFHIGLTTLNRRGLHSPCRDHLLPLAGRTWY